MFHKVLIFYSTEKLKSIGNHFVLILQCSPEFLLRKCINTAVRTAVRSLIKATRLMEEYKGMVRGTNSEGLSPSSLIMFDNGYFTTISGAGEVYHSFCKDKNLGNYTGRFAFPKHPSDPGYETSLLRMLPFDHTFTFLPTDVNARK